MKKILLIGDSIRLGYDRYVKMALEDVAQVCYPANNCRFASYIVRHLPDWIAETGCGEEVDLVYWNAGLWDGLIMADGMHHTPLDIYAYYIDRICNLLKMFFPRAKIIFATSTPVQEELFTGWLKRYNKDTQQYNQTASRIVIDHGGQVDDLYALAMGAPVSYHSDQTHYYTKDGTRMFTEHIVATLENALGIQGKALDYDALFTEKENIVGL